ncbi:MAG: ribonuclease HIII [bacterium]
MNTQTKAEVKFNEIKNQLSQNDFTVLNEKKLQYNFECEAKKGIDKIKIQVYFGKNGVKIVLQGNPESKIYDSVNTLISGDMKLNFGESDPEEPDEYIGTDESGKGDYFGPLVTSAVYINPQIKAELLKLNVRDSKELFDNQIDFIAEKMKSIKGVVYDTIVITPQKYNALYEKFGNLNKLLNWAHSKCIENIFEKTKCKSVISDKFSKEVLQASIKLSGKIQITQIHKAEKYTAVAAASILARSEFNKWFYIKKREGFDLQKGASDLVIQKAREIVKKHGQNSLLELAKLHFKTSKKIF